MNKSGGILDATDIRHKLTRLLTHPASRLYSIFGILFPGSLSASRPRTRIRDLVFPFDRLLFRVFARARILSHHSHAIFCLRAHCVSANCVPSCVIYARAEVIQTRVRRCARALLAAHAQTEPAFSHGRALASYQGPALNARADELLLARPCFD